MRRLRPLAALLLASVLVITSGAMAAARGQAAPAGEIVLCTGTGTLIVPVDAQGNPSGPAHICPDCALHLFAMPAPPTAVPVPSGAWSAPAFANAQDSAVWVRPAPLPPARGPPAAI